MILLLTFASKGTICKAQTQELARRMDCGQTVLQLVNVSSSIYIVHACMQIYTHKHNELTSTAVDCGPLDDPENGRVDVLGTTLGSPAIYRCSQGFELIGEERRVCTVTGQWSDEAPECRGIERFRVA